MKNKRFFLIALPILGALVLTGSVFLFLLSHGEEHSDQTIARGEDRQVYLIAGVDEAGANTDALMLLSVSTDSGRMHLMQIPRDTYYKTDNGEGKINRLYRTYLSKYGTKGAADALTAEISRAFGIPIDGYAVTDIGTLGSLVDILGGVTVNVPFSMVFFDPKSGTSITLEEGERHLTGDEAVLFVRHRASYTEGDLGRLDAQMRFLSGMLTALPNLKTPSQFHAIAEEILPNLLTNLSEKDIINLIMVYLRHRNTVSVEMMRLPGEAVRGAHGASYYVVSRAAAERMLLTRFGAESPFDASCRFTRDDREAFMNIYRNPSTAFSTYTPSEAARIKILRSV